MRRKWLLAAALLLAGLAGAEWWRRARAVSEPAGNPGGVAVARDAKLPDLAQPVEFDRFCALVRAEYLAMDDRYKSLQHRERKLAESLDSAGAVAGAEVRELLVDFPAGQERRETVSLTDAKTGQPTAEDSAIQKDVEGNSAPFFYPFSRQATPADFDHAFAGYERLAGATLAKIAFTPKEPLGRKLVGHVWADPRTGTPRRFQGLLAKPVFPVERIELAFTYAVAENGQPQLKQALSDAKGGVLLVQRRYRVTIDFDRYAAPSP
jgi:hypothetical protein